MMDQEYEERRAANLIWNAAGAYDFRPDYRAFDSKGEADLYFNSIIGGARRCYDFVPLQKLFSAFRLEPEGEFYANLLWLGLENGVYERTVRERPALAELREAYARHEVEAAAPVQDRDLYETLRIAHFERALGLEPEAGEREKAILKRLEFQEDMDGEAVAEQMRRLLREYFWADPEADEKIWRRRKTNWLSRFFQKRSGDPTLFPVRYLKPDEDKSGSGGREAKEEEAGLRLLFHAQAKEEKLRRFIESSFGRSVYDKKGSLEMEKRLCTGIHTGCFLHVTRGEYGTETAENEEARLTREERLKQGQRNRSYFRAHLGKNRRSIASLTGKLQNSILLYMEAAEEPARFGRLASEKAWRLQYLQDPKIFWRREPGEIGGLTVDILLDASASQRDQQDKVSCQAYIIAQSLTNCGVPVRVYSFQSVSGCTVVHLFRDYGEPEKNTAIFDYAASGWNRDGLALRVAGDFLKQTDSDHRLLIVLSDASPNDDQKIISSEGLLSGHSYEGRRGVEDAAAEVNRLRQEGAAVMCVFTGTERDLPSARKIYGNEVAQIRSIDQFADRVGSLILGQIRLF